MSVRTSRKTRIGAGALAVVAIGLVGFSLYRLSPLGFHTSKPSRHVGDASQTTQASPDNPLPAVPQCAPASGSSSTQVSLSVPSEGPFRFDPSCIYAPADTPFTITFANVVTGTHDGNGVEENVAIYPDQASAVTVHGNLVGIGPQNRKTALFIGD